MVTVIYCYKTNLYLPDNLLFAQHYIFLWNQLLGHRVPIPVESNILEVICTNSNFHLLWFDAKCPGRKNVSI